MTENLFQKLEEKMMMLLTEVEESRKKIQYLSHENSLLEIENKKLQIEKENHARKLTDLISLLDSINAADTLLANVSNQVMEPLLAQG